MSDILLDIIAHKRTEIANARAKCPPAELERRLRDAPPPRDFVAALTAASATMGIGLIAEVKKASPSAGLIRDRFDPVKIARDFENHGAACVSVLSDAKFFQGSLDDLRAVRQAVSLPVLRKDFLIDPYQILEARVAGADCVLLIAECLTPGTLRELSEYAIQLGMQPLIEIYEPENLAHVLELGPRMIGVNNRNLRTFATDLEHTVRLRKQIPEEVLLVSESGIATREDVVRLQQAGVKAILVGETLMRAADIGAKVDELLGKERSMP